MYAILLGAPSGPTLTIEDLPLAEGGRVALLGRGALPWRRDGAAVRVELGVLPAGASAHALALTGAR